MIHRWCCGVFAVVRVRISSASSAFQTACSRAQVLLQSVGFHLGLASSSSFRALLILATALMGLILVRSSIYPALCALLVQRLSFVLRLVLVRFENRNPMFVAGFFLHGSVSQGLGISNFLLENTMWLGAHELSLVRCFWPSHSCHFIYLLLSVFIHDYLS